MKYLIGFVIGCLASAAVVLYLLSDRITLEKAAEMQSEYETYRYRMSNASSMNCTMTQPDWRRYYEIKYQLQDLRK